MSLLEILQFIQQQNIILRAGRSGCIRIWSPNNRVSRSTRQAIKAHAEMLLSMLSSHDVNVCPNRLLHRQEWHAVGNGRYSCGMCERLQPYLDMRPAQQEENHLEEQKAS